jgi:hypothetical protein
MRCHSALFFIAQAFSEMVIVRDVHNTIEYKLLCLQAATNVYGEF